MKICHISLFLVSVPQRNCGVPSVSDVGGSARIVGGVKVTSLQRWPWIAALTTNTYKLRCGVTIVAPQWVLTSAHCVNG